jgi:ABC-type Fe3+ transport system substrate-binding protein
MTQTPEKNSSDGRFGHWGLEIRLLLLVALLLPGCRGTAGAPSDPRAPEADRQVRAKYGKGLDELPTLKLVAISPHNGNIQNEFAWAFSLHHAVEYGQKVAIEWRDVGGGGSTIEQYLYNVYARSDTSGIDILWGGGDQTFVKLAPRNILQPLTLSEDSRRNIPADFGGLRMYDEQFRWVGSALSGFGFIYNAGMLKRCRIAPPTTWDDLADPRFADLVILADPKQSSTAAVMCEMIVQSAPTWPEGWAKLLGVLGNAKRFADSGGAAANAPVLGEALISTCVDFYGVNRVAEAPEELLYVSPHGQTAFTPDPIAILKNPPSPVLAQRFVDFVLSRRGQALWALRVGETDGPIRSPLGREPIRPDVYKAYAGKMLPWIVNPYEAGAALRLDVAARDIRSGVLKNLITAAALDNRDDLRAARRRLIQTGFEPARLAEFNRLPDNVATREALAAVAKIIERADKDKDPEAVREMDRILTEWSAFFRQKYRKVAE